MFSDYVVFWFSGLMETSVALVQLEEDKEQNLALHFVRGVGRSLKHLSFLQSTEQNSSLKHW